MKYSKIGICIIVAMLTGCASLGTLLFGDPDAKLRWPVAVVPWENVLNRIDSSEVVIVCLVDAYDPNNLTMSDSNSGPALFPSRRSNEVTPAQVLASYLRGVRSLEGKDIMTPSGEPNPKKMTIFVVASGDQTRDRAGELFTKFGIRYYDRTIPVIYVFQNKQLITSYTYTRNPGENGEKLRKQVSDLFKLQ